MANSTPFHILLNQAVQIELADQSTRYCAVVTNFLTNQIVLRFPQYSQLPEGLRAGIPISLRCFDISGLRVGQSRVAELCAPSRPGVVVDLPPLFETIQKRRFFRVEVDFPCQLQELRSEGPAGDMDLEARLLDLSAGGARVATTRALKPDGRVQIEFVPQASVVSKTPAGQPAGRPASGLAPTPPAAVPSIRANAKVVRVVPAPNGLPELMHVGIEFERLPSSTEDRLVNLVFDVQRGQCHSRPGGGRR